MSPLLGAQVAFARDVPKLIEHAFQLGYLVTFGETYRTAAQAEINAMGHQQREEVAQLIERQFPMLGAKIRATTGDGIRLSLHCDRLAIDLNLFDQLGNYLATPSAYRELATFWMAQGVDHCAGVTWGDPDHYSISFDGRK